MPRNLVLALDQIKGVVSSNISPGQSLVFTAEVQIGRLSISCLKIVLGKSLVLTVSLYLQSDSVAWAEIITRWQGEISYRWQDVGDNI